VEPAPPETRALVAAAEAIAAARKIVEQTAALGLELERLAAPVAELLSPVISGSASAPGATEGSSRGIETLARALARRRRKFRRRA
jgi:hypothetical protein